MKKKVAVLMGGISTEREVSLNSGKSVVDALDRDKYEVYEIILIFFRLHLLAKILLYTYNKNKNPILPPASSSSSIIWSLSM